MIKNITMKILLLLFFLILTTCQKQPQKIYNIKTIVEFKNVSQSKNGMYYSIVVSDIKDNILNGCSSGRILRDTVIYNTFKARSNDNIQLFCLVYNDEDVGTISCVSDQFNLHISTTEANVGTNSNIVLKTGRLSYVISKKFILK